MYHQYRKDSSRVRQAIFKVYDGKCQYCGIQMQIRHMHIDHIVPQNANQTREKDVIQYLSELTDNGFILDSIENYLPVCSACNRKKSNTLFSANNLRYYHEIAKIHTQDILSYIEKDTTDEQFFEPVNPNVWEQVTFANQHDISYAIMGYRLGPSDVKVCPRTPQVRDIIRQLSIVDYPVDDIEP